MRHSTGWRLSGPRVIPVAWVGVLTLAMVAPTLRPGFTLSYATGMTRGPLRRQPVECLMGGYRGTRDRTPRHPVAH
ncbi:MAG: hypothetical protein ACKOFP_13425, partial [Actinomycetota bacterium]